MSHDVEIETWTGQRFKPFAATVGMIDPLDICGALSQLCRFGGHTRKFYSVAQHSVLVHDIIEAALLENSHTIEGKQQTLLAGLLHDAHEAYLLDVPAPIKPHVNGYACAAHQVQTVIDERFGVKHDLVDHQAIRLADKAALRIEARDLMHSGGDWWINQANPLNILCRIPLVEAMKVEPLPPTEAHRMFWFRLFRYESCFVKGVEHVGVDQEGERVGSRADRRANAAGAGGADSGEGGQAGV